MSDYTPTTEVIIHRLEYPNERLGEPRPITRAQFERWLAEHDRQTKAQAWDEGYRTSCQDHGGYTSCGTGPDPHNASHTNPYKEEA